MDMDRSAPALSPEDLDALILQAGLVLSPAERDDVLAAARALQRAAALVRNYNAEAERSGLAPD